DRQAMGVRPGILADARDLPGDAKLRRATGDAEAIVVNLVGNVHGGKGPEAGELIAKIPVQGPEPSRQLDRCFAGIAELDDTVVGVFHIRPRDEGVDQILVGRMEGMIDLDPASRLGNRTRDGDGTFKVSRGARSTPEVSRDARRTHANHAVVATIPKGTD